jgi:hypothetical protein
MGMMKKADGAAKEESLGIPLGDFADYPLPGFLEGRCSHSKYLKWLNNKADTLVKRDKKRGKPYALAATECVYKKEIHDAVLRGGDYDPYTGERLVWELISEWDTSNTKPDGYKKKFGLMPTVDHITEDKLKFEICSWRINGAKSDLGPGEFVELCAKVINFRGFGPSAPLRDHSVPGG